jgi:uncharacterized protein with PIN domain
MKFVVDAMFGRLARWLRMSGYDTIYDVDLKDGRLVKLAKDRGRVLLTRDKEVYTRAKKEDVRATFISSLSFQDQLTQIKKEYGVVFKESPIFSRCPMCNESLVIADKNDIKAKLPERVADTYDEFWTCQGCGKVYWHGGHWKNVKDIVRKLRSEER